jgi:hypothetical protein
MRYEIASSAIDANQRDVLTNGRGSQVWCSVRRVPDIDATFYRLHASPTIG